MTHDILHPDRTIKRHITLSGLNLQVPEFRQPLGERIVQIELALFDQHHRGCGDNGLGHRGQAKQRVLGHGFGLGGIQVAMRFIVHNFAIARDQGDSAGKHALLNLRIHRG